MKADPNKVIKTEPKMVKEGWGLVSDVDGLYNRIYWTDNKLVKVEYDGTTYNNITVKTINNCVD